MPRQKTTAVRILSSEEQLRAEAYELLEISPAEVEQQAKIEHLFKAIGGKDVVFNYLEGSEEPIARKVLEGRRLLDVRQLAAVPFEALCVYAKISPRKMFGLIAEEVAYQTAQASTLLARASHPDVVAATVAMSLLPSGTQERLMLHKAQGFVPVPKNSVTHVHGNQSIDARQQSVAVSVLPPVEDDIRRMSDRFLKVTPAPPPACMVPQEDPDSEHGEDEE